MLLAYQDARRIGVVRHGVDELRPIGGGEKTLVLEVPGELLIVRGPRSPGIERTHIGGVLRDDRLPRPGEDLAGAVARLHGPGGGTRLVCPCSLSDFLRHPGWVGP